MHPVHPIATPVHCVHIFSNIFYHYIEIFALQNLYGNPDAKTHLVVYFYVIMQEKITIK